MLASEHVVKALRLINVPGRGASLVPEDQTAAFEALQDLLNSKSVSKQFVPGIRRHFFDMISGKAIYSYGVGSGVDLRSDDFDDDPAPIKIEDAYIREGSTITNNEQVDEYRFENVGDWTLANNGKIQNNQLVLEDFASANQLLGLVAGRTYTVRFNLQVNIGSCHFSITENFVDILDFDLEETDTYEFDFLFSTTVPVVLFDTQTDNDAVVTECSIIERGKERIELPDSRGSDYTITIIDQGRYNRRFTKGTGGRPYELLYSRGFPNSEIRFDNSAITGDILVMDVLVNRVAVNSLQSVVRLNPEADLWLRYAVADIVAAEYGKGLTLRQIQIMDDAWNDLSSGNRRTNTLGVDPALRDRPTFDINRGDP